MCARSHRHRSTNRNAYSLQMRPPDDVMIIMVGMLIGANDGSQNAVLMSKL